MILRPVTAYPDNGVAVDIDKNVEFSTTIEGSSAQVTAYSYTAYDANTFVQQDPGVGTVTLSNELVAGDTLSFLVDNDHPAHTGQTLIQNGNSYYWILRLYQEKADMFVASGLIKNVSSTTTFTTMNNPNVINGMYVDFSDGVSNKGLWEIQQVYRYTSGSYAGQMEITITTPTFTLDSTFKNKNFKVFSKFIDSQPFYFFARETPTVSITDSGLIDTMNKTFTATYSQANGDGIKWYKFILTDEYGEFEYDNTGEIYSSALTYYADGLIDGQKYKLTCEVCTINNMTAKTSLSFTPQYSSPKPIRNVAISQLDNKDAVRLTWNGDYTVPARDRSEHNIVDDMINISAGNIYYEKVNDENLNISDESTFLTDVIINQNTKEILSLEWGRKSQPPEISIPFPLAVRKDFNDANKCEYATMIDEEVKNSITGFYMRDIAYGSGVYVAVGDAGQSYISKDLKEWYFVEGMSPSGSGGEISFGQNMFCALGSDGKFYYLNISQNDNIKNLNWTVREIANSTTRNSLIYSNIGFILSVDNNKNLLTASGTSDWVTIGQIGGMNFFVNNRIIISKDNNIYEYNGTLNKIGTSPTSKGIYKMIYSNSRYIMFDEDGSSYYTTDFNAWIKVSDLLSKPINLFIDKIGQPQALLTDDYIYTYENNSWSKKTKYRDGILLTCLNSLIIGYSTFNQLKYGDTFENLTSELSLSSEIFPRGDVRVSTYGNEMTMIGFNHLYYYITDNDGNTFSRVYGINPEYNISPKSLVYGEPWFVTSCNGKTYASYNGGMFELTLDKELVQIEYGGGRFVGEAADGKLIGAIVNITTLSWENLGSLPANVIRWSMNNNGVIMCYTADNKTSYSIDYGQTWVSMNDAFSSTYKDKAHTQLKTFKNDIFILCFNNFSTISNTDVWSVDTYYLDASSNNIGTWQKAQSINGSLVEDSLVSSGKEIYCARYLSGESNKTLTGRMPSSGVFSWEDAIVDVVDPISTTTERLSLIGNNLYLPSTIEILTLKLENNNIIKEYMGEKEVLAHIDEKIFTKRYKVAILPNDIQIKEVVL